MTPTDEQYASFGNAVAGIMDAHISGGIADAGAIEVIKLAAQTYGIEFRTFGGEQ